MSRIPVYPDKPTTVAATSDDQKKIIAAQGTLNYSSPAGSGSLTVGQAVTVSENTQLVASNTKGYAHVLDVAGKLDYLPPDAAPWAATTDEDGYVEVSQMPARVVGSRPTGTASTDTAAIEADIARCQAAGGGGIQFWPGVYALNDVIVWPNNVWPIGAGKGTFVSQACTVFRRSTAGAGFSFGAFAAQGRFGDVRDFTLDGNDLGGGPLLTVCSVNSRYTSIKVQDVDDDGVLIDGAQNNQLDIEVTDCSGSCVVFDRGAGQNRWYGEIARASEYLVKFIQSANTDAEANYYSEPTQNTFWGPVIERMGTSIGGGTVGSGLGGILHEAGQDNRFVGCCIALDNDDDGVAAVKTDVGASVGGYTPVSQRLTFDNCNLSGEVTHTTAFDMNGSTSVVLSGDTVLRGFAVGFAMEDTDVVRDNTAANPYSSVTAIFSGKGSSAADTLIRRRTVSPTQVNRPSATDNAIVAVVDGDAGTRWFWRMNALYAGSGGSNSIANFSALYYQATSGAARGWRMDGELTAADGIRIGQLGPMDKTGTGSPEGVLSAPPGSLWRRSDGDALTSLYFKMLGSGNTGWATIRDRLQVVATDSNVTLSPITSAERLLHSGTLTTDRTVTLSTTSAATGMVFHVTRTGAGAFNLGVGGLKNLAQNEWCEVTYNGSAWVLTKFGAL